jgi:hypothetical protein
VNKPCAYLSLVRRLPLHMQLALICFPVSVSSADVSQSLALSKASPVTSDCHSGPTQKLWTSKSPHNTGVWDSRTASCAGSPSDELILLAIHAILTLARALGTIAFLYIQNCQLPIRKKQARHMCALTFLDSILLGMISDMMPCDCSWTEMVRLCGKKGEK